MKNNDKKIIESKKDDKLIKTNKNRSTKIVGLEKTTFKNELKIKDDKSDLIEKEKKMIKNELYENMIELDEIYSSLLPTIIECHQNNDYGILFQKNIEKLIECVKITRKLFGVNIKLRAIDNNTEKKVEQKVIIN